MKLLEDYRELVLETESSFE